MINSSNTQALHEIFRFWQLVIIKVRFNLRSEASQSYLSYAWWIFEPLSVVSAVLATLLAIEFGFTMVIVAALVCYALAAVVIAGQWGISSR